MTLNLRHLRLFLAVAEDLHFSRAAERMGVAEPAMSRAIRSLEGRLDTSLFKRNSRNVALTSAGRMLQVEGQRALDQLTAAISATRAAAEGKHGVLRIGYMDFALHGVFPAVLKQFRARYPGVAVIARASFTERIEADLASDRIDVGFLLQPVTDPVLESKPVQNDSFVVVVPDTHPLATKPVVTLGDLAEEPLIMGRRDTWTPYVRIVEDLCRQVGFWPTVVQEADSTEGIFAFVASGLGSAIYVQRACERAPSGTVVRCLADISSTTITSELAWRRQDDSPTVRNFIDLSASFL